MKGQSSETLHVRVSPWGPVAEFFGNNYALLWTAHDPRAGDINLIDMEKAGSVEEAMSIANRAGTPPLNFVAADIDGNIGWTIMGRIPRRGDKKDWDAADATRPETLWRGWLDPAEYPRILNPESGLIWTANNRVASGRALEIVGDGGYFLGARARQVRDDLLALDKPIVADMLKVQLDDRAVFLNPWRDLFLQVLDAVGSCGQSGEKRVKRSDQRLDCASQR